MHKNLKNADSVESQTSPLTPTPDRPPGKVALAHDNMSESEFKKWRRAQESQFSVKNGKKHHPYPSKVAPFPRSYDRSVLDHEMWEALFFEQMLGGICFHEFAVPPARVLDLGCGTGHWIISAARKWKNTHFVGVDIVPIQPDLRRVGLDDLASRITWVNANFLEKLPLPDDHFDFAVVKRIGRAVPEDKSHFVFEELLRVLKPGGSLELLDEDLYFPGSKTEGGEIATATSTPAPSIHKYTGESKFRSDCPSSSSFHSEGSELTPGSLTRSTDDDQERHSEKTCSEPSSSYYGRDNSFETARVYQPSDTSSEFSIDDHSKSYLSSIKSRKRFSLGYREPVSHLQAVAGRTRSYSCTREDVTQLEEERLKYDETPTPTNMYLCANKPTDPLDNSTPSPGSGATQSTDFVMVGAPSESTFLDPDIVSDLDQDNVDNRKHTRYGSVALNNLEPEALQLYPQDVIGGFTHRRESDASLLQDPSPTQPLNPRDHSLLTRIYDEMHADRFINLSPLSLIGAYLNIYFVNVKSHAPVSFTFPPKPQSYPEGEIRDDNEIGNDAVDGSLPSLSNEDLDWLVHSSFVTGPKLKQTSNVTSQSTTNSSGSQHHNSTGRSSFSYSAHESAASQFIVIDSARLPAAPKFRQTPRINTASPVSTSGPSSNGQTTIAMTAPYNLKSNDISATPHSTTDSLSVPQNASEAHYSDTSSVPPSPADSKSPDFQSQNQGSKIKQINTSRGQSSDVRVNLRPKVLDMKSLHLHLSIRVAETLACAESMWEWVLAEQARHARDMKGGLTRRGENERDRQREVIWAMTREEFDQCLSRFEMDMQDKMYLDNALELYLGMKQCYTSKSAERRSFDAAVAAWDNLQAQLQSSSSQVQSQQRPQARTVTSSLRHQSQRIHVQVASRSNNNSNSNFGYSQEDVGGGSTSDCTGSTVVGSGTASASDVTGSASDDAGQAPQADRRSMMSSSTGCTEGGQRLLSRTIRIFFASKPL